MMTKIDRCQYTPVSDSQISPGGNPGENKLKIWHNLNHSGKTLTPVKITIRFLQPGGKQK